MISVLFTYCLLQPQHISIIDKLEAGAMPSFDGHISMRFSWLGQN
jgi:hypothetical protein